MRGQPRKTPHNADPAWHPGPKVRGRRGRPDARRNHRRSGPALILRIRQFEQKFGPEGSTPRSALSGRRGKKRRAWAKGAAGWAPPIEISLLEWSVRDSLEGTDFSRTIKALQIQEIVRDLPDRKR